VKSLGWTVRALVVLGDALAVIALGVWGTVWLVVVVPAGLAAALLLARRPFRRFDRRIIRPAVKALVFGTVPDDRSDSRIIRPAVRVLMTGLAGLSLWTAGYPTLAIGLLIFSAAVNGLAQMPAIRALQPPEATDTIQLSGGIEEVSRTRLRRGR
jgi:hypothetical protein